MRINKYNIANFDDLCESAGVDIGSDKDDLDYAYEDYPILEYIMKIKKFNKNPSEKSEKTFLAKFREFEDSINEGTNPFN